MLDEEQTRPLVRAATDEAGITDPKQADRVIGLVKKTFSGQVEPAPRAQARRRDALLQ